MKKYSVGDEVAGLVIQGIPCNGSASDTVYAVRYNCCGKEAEMKGRSLQYRITRKSTQCHACTNKTVGRSRCKLEFYPPGTKLTGLKILAVYQTTPKLNGITYEVKYDCCGKISTLTRYSLNRRITDHHGKCKVCGLEEVNKRTKEQLPVQVPLTSFWEGPLWPVPGR